VQSPLEELDEILSEPPSSSRSAGLLALQLSMPRKDFDDLRREFGSRQFATAVSQ
jgi:hypothetical protein